VLVIVVDVIVIVAVVVVAAILLSLPQNAARNIYLFMNPKGGTYGSDEKRTELCRCK